MMPCIPYLSYLSYIPYIPYIWNVITTPTIHTIANIHAIYTIPTLHRKYSIPIQVIIHTIQTMHTVISNIPYPTDLHTIPTIHTIPTTHAIHTIPTIHTKHTVLSKHAIPDRPYTPYIPNIPYDTPTTPQGGRGTVPHRHHTTGGGGGRSHISYGASIWDPSHWGGGGGVAGPGAYIYIYTWVTINTPAEEFYTHVSLDYVVVILWCISPGRCKKAQGWAHDILVLVYVFSLQLGCVVLNGFSRASINFLETRSWTSID